MSEQPQPTQSVTTVPAREARQRPLNSLVAAASRLTQARIREKSDQRKSTAQGWQDEAWEMYDLVGEQRFLMTTLGGRCGQARFYVGKLTGDPTEPPNLVEEGKPAEAFSAFGNGSPSQVAQLIARLSVNLGVAGDGYLVGIPDILLHPERHPDELPDPNEALLPLQDEDRDPADPAAIDLESLQWRMLSVSEVSFDEDGQVTLQMGDSKEDARTFNPDELFLIRVWRPHPRKWWQADSPTRASLPVLRELVGLTMHIGAQVDSRLAGAGILLVPSEAANALKQQAGGTDAEDDSDDAFTDSLINAMTTPINDRSSASALVPLVLEVPGEQIQNFRHISFATDLDAEARELRDEAIRRLALGQDAPPEILLGTGGMNHWGAWLVREDTITTHIEPPLALICDALTTQFLWPILTSGENAMSEEQAQEYVIWFDVDHLIMRPNRTADAAALFAAGALSAESYRDAAGFSENDAPPAIKQIDPAVQTALDMVKAAPSLAQAPGLQVLVDQLRAIMSGSSEEIPAAAPSNTDTPEPPPEDESESQGGNGLPEDTTDEDTDPEAIAAGAGPLVDGQPLMPVAPPPPPRVSRDSSDIEQWLEKRSRLVGKQAD